MKPILLLLVVFVSSSLVSVASIGARVSAAALEDCRLQNVSGALASPTSSERFFRAGRQQLEREVQRLQRGFKVQASDVLKIEPSIFQPQRNLQQLEQQFLDGANAPPKIDFDKYFPPRVTKEE